MKNNDIAHINRIINILNTVKMFLQNDYYIYELAEELNFSKSCIQRYLNDPIIEKILGSEIVVEIKEKINGNLQNGRLKGSENYVINNEAIKLENGKFCGSFPKKRGKYDKRNI